MSLWLISPCLWNLYDLTPSVVQVTGRLSLLLFLPLSLCLQSSGDLCHTAPRLRGCTGVSSSVPRSSLPVLFFLPFNFLSVVFLLLPLTPSHAHTHFPPRPALFFPPSLVLATLKAATCSLCAAPAPSLIEPTERRGKKWKMRKRRRTVGWRKREMNSLSWWVWRGQHTSCLPLFSLTHICGAICSAANNTHARTYTHSHKRTQRWGWTWSELLDVHSVLCSLSTKPETCAFFRLFSPPTVPNKHTLAFPWTRKQLVSPPLSLSLSSISVTSVAWTCQRRHNVPSLTLPALFLLFINLFPVSVPTEKHRLPLSLRPLWEESAAPHEGETPPEISQITNLKTSPVWKKPYFYDDF